ncbi:MAG: selenide, water dikinase SelD [Coriobacteriia bacterium]|nr:selenide, water dikinase SelD [Coriobacteriia bacterium]
MQGSTLAAAALDGGSDVDSSKLMLGFETSDDAAVYRMNDDIATLLTVDFFTPIVDDPYDFGRITAANALSDIYAMGGRPLTAMNLVAFPSCMGPEVVGEVLRGGAEKVAEAGALIVGGHTIDDSEPKYGMSVMGTVHPDKVLYNRGARPGDALVLTKPLGTGIWGTALKRDLYDDKHPQARAAIEMMATLNRQAAEALQSIDVAAEHIHACTDITGFGLAGHLHEMMLASGTAAAVELDALPLLEGTWELSANKIRPGKTSEIIDWAQGFMKFANLSDEELKSTWQGIVCDPQTSGGLLLSMSEEVASDYLALCPTAVKVGTVTGNTPGRICFQ